MQPPWVVVTIWTNFPQETSDGLGFTELIEMREMWSEKTMASHPKGQNLSM